MRQESRKKLYPFFGGSDQKAEPQGQGMEEQRSSEEWKREKIIGGYLGPNGEEICEICAERLSVIVQHYDFLPGAPGWPRFTCEYCGVDF